MSSLVEAARFTFAYQAELARAYLESHAVHAVVFDGQSSLYSDGAITGVRVMVLDEDYAEAREILRSYEA